MSASPFVATLRARPEPVQMATGAGSLTLRVQLSEAWDAVRVVAAPTESVAAVKLRALEALDPSAAAPGEYVVTNRGIQLFDEASSLANAGVVNGATLLIAHRHRRPVR